MIAFLKKCLFDISGGRSYRIILYTYRKGPRQILFDYTLSSESERAARAEFTQCLDIGFPMVLKKKAPDSKTIKVLNLAMKRAQKWGDVAAFAGGVLDYPTRTAHVYLYHHPRAGYSISQKLKRIIGRYGIDAVVQSVDDASFSLYTQQLLPDEYTLHRLQNERISYGLKKRGIDIGVLHTICFFVRFDLKVPIDGAKEKLIRNGYAMRSESADDEGILLAVEKRARLGIDTLNALTDWLIATLQPFSGKLSHYDVEPLA